jgi:hypothetical protein
MTRTSRFTLIVALAAISIASPAFAQSSHGEQVTGSASNRQDLNFGSYSSDFGSRNNQVAVGQSGREKTAARANGRGAYAMVPHARTLYDYSPDFPGMGSDSSYNPGTSGYDPGIETQR